ncbi:MAG: phosphatase PAP2 family protein, partial [Proteobacteria bacterium]|nr:phosphatase PAP2 family protein [Pseudomonadota bacterium]
MTLKLYLLLTVAAVALFLVFPSVDIAVSGWFYRPGAGWEPGYAPVLGAIHAGVPYLLGAVMLAALGLFIGNLVRGTDMLQLRARGLGFVVLALLLGPGLLANVVLKDNWGRARPSHLVEFGGKSAFTPPLLLSDACDHNCAFVAGDAAAGYFLLAFALLARRRRKLAIAGALAVGTALGAVRVIQGGHFLSDVVFAGLFVGGLIWLLHHLIMTPGGRAAATRWRARAGRLAIAALAIAGLAVISMFVIDRPVAAWVERFDPTVRQLFSQTARPGLSTGWLIGSALLALGGFAVAGWSADAARRQRWRSYALAPLHVFASVALAGLATDLVKTLVGRFRPKLFFRDGSYGFDFLHTRADYVSFPSGHATTAFALATAFTLLWPRYAVAYFLAAAVIGASRVLSNAHWVSDVLAGAVVGTAAALYARAVFGANGVAVADLLRGTAAWHAAPTWPTRLALDSARACLKRASLKRIWAAAASC